MPVEVSGSRREIGKAQRRRRIVEAAAALVREHGSGEVSMVMVAERAGVSPGTLYNLFQTKAAIFQEVFDLDLDEFAARLQREPGDPLDKLFVAVRMAADLYRREPRFYKAMALMGRRDGEGSASAIAGPRVDFWRQLVQDLADQGLLVAGTNASLLGASVARSMRGIFLEWAGGSISAERLAREADFALASLCHAHATGPARRRLASRLRT
ncbi:MAG: TetR/AcrR family transcriptional regulator [Burkholderiaceae bacterium]